MKDRRRRVTRRDVGKQFSEGARLAGSRIRRLGWSVRQAARELEMDATRLQRVLYGDVEPSVKDALSIQDVLDVDIDLFRRAPRQVQATG